MLIASKFTLIIFQILIFISLPFYSVLTQSFLAVSGQLSAVSFYEIKKTAKWILDFPYQSS
jgi:hypothetical protein